MKRRDFLFLAGGLALETGLDLMKPARLMAASDADYTLRIAPVSMDLAPGKTIRTTGYNGTVPGPVLRMREGKKISVDVFNDTDIPEFVHWHGLFIPPEVDGAEEEGTPVVPAHGQQRYTFTPRPAGARWYHTHSMAGTDLTRGAYNGQFGFLYIEPKSEPGNYDQEIFLAAHSWEPSLVHRAKTNDVGMDVMFGSYSLNDKPLGRGEPIRVRQGQRILFHFLNASPTGFVNLSFPGHKFKVIALDGSPVPKPLTVEAIQLAVAERLDAVVEMNEPGVWILGAIRDEDRAKGMGVVVEYAGQQGEPHWVAPTAGTPANTSWDYTMFGFQKAVPEPDEKFEMTFKRVPEEGVIFNRWTINGKSWPDIEPLRVKAGGRYRLVMHGGDEEGHPMHLHRHSLELTNFFGKPTSGLIKDIIAVPKSTTVEADFVADQPGLALFHCHMQAHMDFGFKMLLKYI